MIIYNHRIEVGKKYETKQEKEAKEQLEREKKRKKASLINTAILLLIIAGLVAFIYIKRDSLFGKEETKIEEKENKETPADEKTTDEKIESTTPQEGTLNDEKKLDSATIILNSKELKLEYKYDEEEEGPGVITLKLNNTAIYDEKALDGISNIKYEVFKATDGKDYLMVKYEQWGIHSAILDENAKLIKSISPYDESTECFISIEKDNKVEDLTSIKNGEVYYYINKGDEPSENFDINIKEIKITIHDGQITETPTGVDRIAKIANCS